jgi:hypothetical protein
MFQKFAINALHCKVHEIDGIGADERHLFLFFFTPTPTRHPKGVQMQLMRKELK